MADLLQAAAAEAYDKARQAEADFVAGLGTATKALAAKAHAEDMATRASVEHWKGVSALTGAMSHLASAGKSAFDSLVNIGRAASPELSKTFDEAVGLLMSTIGVSLAPMLFELGAVALDLAATFATAAFAVAKFTAGLTSEIYGSIKESIRNPKFLFTGVPEERPEEERGESGLKKWMEVMLNSLEVNMGQAAPKFEAASAAYARVQQAEAGMTDMAKLALEQRRKMLDLLRELVYGKGGADDSKPDAGAGGAWD